MAFALEGPLWWSWGRRTDQGGRASSRSRPSSHWEFSRKGCGDDGPTPGTIGGGDFGAQSDILSARRRRGFGQRWQAWIWARIRRTNWALWTAQEGVGVVGRAVGFAHQRFVGAGGGAGPERRCVRLILAEVLDGDVAPNSAMTAAASMGSFLARRAAGTGVVADTTGLDNADVGGPAAQRARTGPAQPPEALHRGGRRVFEGAGRGGLARCVGEVLLLAGQMQGYWEALGDIEACVGEGVQRR